MKTPYLPAGPVCLLWTAAEMLNLLAVDRHSLPTTVGKHSVHAMDTAVGAVCLLLAGTKQNVMIWIAQRTDVPTHVAAPSSTNCV